MKNKPYLLLMTLLFLLASSTPHAAETSSSHAAAWEALRTGKAIGLLRHALAPGTGDPLAFDVDDCSTQRNLSEQGRAQARAIGDALRQNGVEPTAVLSSQWCRCMDTATLLGFQLPQGAPMLNSFYRDRSTAKTQTDALLSAMKTWRSNHQGVRLLVTHQVNISELTGQFASSGELLIVSLEGESPSILASVKTEPK